MNRLPFVPENPDDPRVKAVFDQLQERWKDAPILHLYRLIGWAPGLLAPWMGFAHAIRFKTVVPAALREIMVVRSGMLLGAEYEWKHHWVAALEEGVPEEKLLALNEWRNSSLYSDAERAVLALADDTAHGTGASQETMDALKALLTTEQLTELVIMAGFYSGVARVINSLGVPLEAGYESMMPQDETK
ncbi:carboxymuconolactone decarboxylase family protein [Alcaligenaceae bacterium]|nr:carboxymuconolactone decarboxylase family protein [Alcaligenaceae bacterium]